MPDHMLTTSNFCGITAFFIVHFMAAACGRDRNESAEKSFEPLQEVCEHVEEGEKSDGSVHIRP